MLSDRFADALSFAAILHQRQVRKGTEIPYVSHLMAVAAHALEHEANETTAIAALLHDALEDQGGQQTAGQIALRFGPDVHLKAWLNLAGLAHGPIFRAVNGRTVCEGELHPRIVNRTLKLAGELAGVDPALLDRLTAHSLRVGPAQDLAINGASVVQIMRAGRWKSVEAMIGYVRRADVNVWSQTGASRSEV